MAQKLAKDKRRGKIQKDDPEFAAMRGVYEALKLLSASAQNRVLDYVFRRLALTREVGMEAIDVTSRISSAAPDQGILSTREEERRQPVEEADGLEGISPVAQKWIRRHSLNVKKLSALFSLGVDDIDLVASKVPGKSKKQRLRSVILLLGVASYLGTGAPRIAYEKLKEAATHYDAHDQGNFAVNMQALAAEVSGARETGYTLTPRGLTAATELVKEMSGG